MNLTLRPSSIIFATAMIAIICYALLLRIEVTNFDRKVVAGDETTYHNAAVSLITDGVIVRNPYVNVDPESPYMRPSLALAPGYPAFLAGIYTIFGQSSSAVFAAQVLLSMGSLILTVTAMALLRIHAAAIVAASVLAALYPGFVYNLDRMLSETLFVFLSLAFVVLLIKYRLSGSFWAVAIAAVTIGAAIQVRSQALPFAPLGLSFAMAFGAGTLQRRAAHGAIFTLLVVATMLPWLAYTYSYFGELTLLPIGGEGAMVWGAVPYYLDMQSTLGKTAAEVMGENAAANPAVYWNWRVFGFLQYMWSDYWDENLVHPSPQLKPFLAIHHLVIIPTLCALPILIWRGGPEHWLIAAFPIGITYLAAPFHGLPRYAFPAVPFLIIAFGCLAGMLIETRPKPQKSDCFKKRMRAAAMIVAAPVAILVPYSTTYFSWQISIQMSKYRISKYLLTGISELAPLGAPITFDAGSFSIDNVSTLEDGRVTNSLGSSAIINLTIPSTQKDDSTVTRVELNVERSSYFDYVTVYWATDDDNNFTESRVYRPPVNFLQPVTTLYLDGDATKLMIVPVYFRNQAFKVESITVQKFGSLPENKAHINTTAYAISD